MTREERRGRAASGLIIKTRLFLPPGEKMLLFVVKSDKKARAAEKYYYGNSSWNFSGSLQRRLSRLPFLPFLLCQLMLSFFSLLLTSSNIASQAEK